MATLDIATAQTTIENALQTTILLAFGKRLTAVANVAALRALVSLGASGSYKFNDNSLIFAGSTLYRWNTYSTAADTGTTVIKPTDAGSAGRWLQQTSTLRYGGQYLHEITTGYLKQVLIFDGRYDDEEIEQHILAQRPTVVIEPSGDTPVEGTDLPGNLYLTDYAFDLWIVSENYRSNREGAAGSPISGEATADPGANAIDGQVQKLLAGSTLATTGVRFVELGAGSVILSDLDQRRFVRSRRITVKATCHLENAGADYVALDRIDVQRKLPADLGAQTQYDDSNYVVSGLEVPLGTGFTKTVSAGSAYIAGALVAASSAGKTFAASKDTYRDLSDAGAWTFVEAEIGVAEPPVTAGALRVGVTRTDAAGVLADTFIAIRIENYQSPDQIEV